MSSTVTAHDLRFRRCFGDECDIVLFGETVGTVSRRPDFVAGGNSHFYVVHLHDDHRGPRQVDDREQVKAVAAEMIAERDLVPSTPPPVHPDFVERRHRDA